MLTHMRTQNDKSMLKYGVCIRRFFFTFCYITISFAVPFITVKMSGALTIFLSLSFEQEPQNKKVFHNFFSVHHPYYN
jgi:hypothetical protein